MMKTESTGQPIEMAIGPPFPHANANESFLVALYLIDVRNPLRCHSSPPLPFLVEVPAKP